MGNLNDIKKLYDSGKIGSVEAKRRVELSMMEDFFDNHDPTKFVDETPTQLADVNLVTTEEGKFYRWGASKDVAHALTRLCQEKGFNSPAEAIAFLTNASPTEDRR